LNSDPTSTKVTEVHRLAPKAPEAFKALKIRDLLGRDITSIQYFVKWNMHLLDGI